MPLNLLGDLVITGKKDSVCYWLCFLCSIVLRLIVACPTYRLDLTIEKIWVSCLNPSCWLEVVKMSQPFGRWLEVVKMSQPFGRWLEVVKEKFNNWKKPNRDVWRKRWISHNWSDPCLDGYFVLHSLLHLSLRSFPIRPLMGTPWIPSITT